MFLFILPFVVLFNMFLAVLKDCIHTGDNTKAPIVKSNVHKAKILLRVCFIDHCSGAKRHSDARWSEPAVRLSGTLFALSECIDSG